MKHRGKDFCPKTSKASCLGSKKTVDEKGGGKTGAGRDTRVRVYTLGTGC